MDIKEIITDFCINNNLDLNTDYSGRWMRGKICYGITCKDPLNTLVQLCDVIRDSGSIKCGILFGRVGMDIVGDNFVVYFEDVSDN